MRKQPFVTYNIGAIIIVYISCALYVIICIHTFTLENYRCIYVYDRNLNINCEWRTCWWSLRRAYSNHI